MELWGQLNALEKSYEDLDDLECSPVHVELSKRMRKTLYAGRAETEGISLPLTDIVVELFENADQGHLGQLSKRHVANLTRRSNATQCSLFLSMIYTKRLRESNPEYVTRIKPAELFLVSMMIATKFLYDEGEEEELYNDEWADAAKMDVNRVHDLEMEFLAAIDWKLLVDPLDFYECLLAVETRIALREGTKRGWFTYTDLSILMQHPSWYEACTTLLEHMVKVISICTLVYSLCTAATVWSALVLHQANIPTQPTNGCLPLPLGPHLAKSTEPHHVYNHLLLDLVLCFYLNHDQQMGSTSIPESPSVCCSVPWYELERQDLSNTGRLFWPSKEEEARVSQEPAEVVATDSCRCRSQQPGSWEGEAAESNRYSGQETWSRRYQDLTNKVGRLRETLVIFYGALLTAWAESPSGLGQELLNPQPLSPDSHPPVVCSGCNVETTAELNSTKGALEMKEIPTCCQTDSRFNGQHHMRHPDIPQESRNMACSSCRGERQILPSLLSLDHINMAFGTSSEILVTM